MYSDHITETDIDKNVISLFSEQAKKTPEAIAIIFEQQTLSYRKLNERANQLAHHLKEQGVKADILHKV